MNKLSMSIKDIEIMNKTGLSVDDMQKIRSKQWLISCRYEEYCQGWEDTWGYFLVTAETFEDACNKLKKKLEKAHDFQDNTVE